MRPRGAIRGRLVFLATGDGVAAAMAFVAAVLLRRAVRLPGTISTLPAENVPLDVFPWLLFVALCAITGFALAATYDEPAEEVRERGGVLVGALVAGALLLVVYFVSGRSFPRTILLVWLPFLMLLAGLWRRLADALVPIETRAVLVLGGGQDARRAAEALGAGEITGHRLFEWREDVESVRPAEDGAPLALGAVPPAVRDVVFATDRAEERATLVALIERSEEQGFDVWLLPGIVDVVASRVVTKSLGDLPLVPVVPRGSGWIARALRRLIDLTLGVALLVVALPLLAFVSASVVLESRGPAWIRQRRVGLRGATFEILKVRTMRADAEEFSGPVLAEKNDARLTRLGPFLRKTRLDELPQLLLVVTGTMSLIGPRPERPEFVAEYTRDVPAYRLRNLMKPGITGLAQVMGAYATKPDVKLRYDLGYLFHWSPLLDLFVLVRTISSVLKGSGT